jgi:hypothetical protein
MHTHQSHGHAPVTWPRILTAEASATTFKPRSTKTNLDQRKRNHLQRPTSIISAGFGATATPKRPCPSKSSMVSSLRKVKIRRSRFVSVAGNSEGVDRDLVSAAGTSDGVAGRFVSAAGTSRAAIWTPFRLHRAPTAMVDGSVRCSELRTKPGCRCREGGRALSRRRRGATA